MTALATQGLPVPTTRSRPHRLNIDVDDDLFEWLGTARREDRLTTSERVRALLELAREDPALRDLVVAKANALAEAEEARRDRR